MTDYTVPAVVDGHRFNRVLGVTERVGTGTLYTYTVYVEPGITVRSARLRRQDRHRARRQARLDPRRQGQPSSGSRAAPTPRSYLPTPTPSTSSATRSTPTARSPAARATKVVINVEALALRRRPLDRSAQDLPPDAGQPRVRTPDRQAAPLVPGHRTDRGGDAAADLLDSRAATRTHGRSTRSSSHQPGGHHDPYRPDPARAQDHRRLRDRRSRKPARSSGRRNFVRRNDERRKGESDEHWEARRKRNRVAYENRDEAVEHLVKEAARARADDRQAQGPQGGGQGGAPQTARSTRARPGSWPSTASPASRISPTGST